MSRRRAPLRGRLAPIRGAIASRIGDLADAEQLGAGEADAFALRQAAAKCAERTASAGLDGELCAALERDDPHHPCGLLAGG